MFERFTEKARRVVVLAAEEARLLEHNYVGTEHVLLGLLRVNDLGGALLVARGLTHDEARARVEATGRPSRAAPLEGHLPFTPRAKKALELSLREALQLGDDFIGSEHLLIGLLREEEGLAAEILHEQGVQLGEVRRGVSRLDRATRRGSDDGPEVVTIAAEGLDHLRAEIARLRDLLERHGIDPDEPLSPEPEGGYGACLLPSGGSASSTESSTWLVTGTFSTPSGRPTVRGQRWGTAARRACSLGLAAAAAWSRRHDPGPRPFGHL